jgi:ribosome-associated heat shock protein Hsp15
MSLRLDQWLWFARFAKSRSRASRLCTAGAVTVNGLLVRRASHAIRVGDTVVVVQGVLVRTIRVKALGERRGPTAEARTLYDEATMPLHVSKLAPAWAPLLADDPTAAPISRNGPCSRSVVCAVPGDRFAALRRGKNQS